MAVTTLCIAINNYRELCRSARYFITNVAKMHYQTEEAFLDGLLKYLMCRQWTLVDFDWLLFEFANFRDYQRFIMTHGDRLSESISYEHVQERFHRSPYCRAYSRLVEDHYLIHVES